MLNEQEHTFSRRPEDRPDDGHGRGSRRFTEEKRNPGRCLLLWRGNRRVPRGTPQRSISDEPSDTGKVRTSASEPWQRREALCEAGPPWLGALRPRELWLTMTGCLSLRWPPCPSLDRQPGEPGAVRPAACPDQSVGSESRDRSGSTNVRSGRTIPVGKGREEVTSRVTKSLPASRHRAACRLSRTQSPRARRTSGSTWEEEEFLWVELVTHGEEGDLCYYAQWRLSERNQELAHGMWLPSHPFLD
ncbi:hypothetical protein NHX12_023101 [Muraenolepis orangiensis]|uniref:Uncharacterized protein n=1 Tax=Muraenolepis orangiensis TaxID=630683 RepID=A0A9Q0EN30_9TELE|nr:hypothetical protein NHX12_023101 [Muraenolepis orangiensis]